MALEAGTWQGERVAGRVWTVRLAPYGRPCAGAVKLSCSRPACADLQFPDTTAGRKAAVAHVNAHLSRIREGGGPRGGAWCACRAGDCAWHAPAPAPVAGRRGVAPSAGAVRCGGPVVLTVYADRAGRLWRIAETCARCAAATPGCRVLETATTASPTRYSPADTGPSADTPDAEQTSGTPGDSTAPVFSDHGSSPAPPPAAAPASVPRARAVSSLGTSPRPKRRAKIAQRSVPHDLQPDALRVELIELGDAFRAYQRGEPDLPRLAELHARKARAFRQWADVSGDHSLRDEAQRAETAAETTLAMHHNRTGHPGDTADGPAVARLLTRQQGEHARTVLDHAATHSPHPAADVRLAVLMLTLRAARDGTGNITGQDLTGWLQDRADPVLQQLVTADWLRLPGTVPDALASRPENPTPITVPTLLPEQPRPLAFGKNQRSKLSGWAQKVIADRKIRKKKAGPATRLLALYTAAHSRPDGHLGHPEDDGLHLDQITAFCTLTPDQIAEHTELLVAADWLTEATTTPERLQGQLTQRALPMSGLL